MAGILWEKNRVSQSVLWSIGARRRYNEVTNIIVINSLVFHFVLDIWMWLRSMKVQCSLSIWYLFSYLLWRNSFYTLSYAFVYWSSFHFIILFSKLLFFKLLQMIKNIERLDIISPLLTIDLICPACLWSLLDIFEQFLLLSHLCTSFWGPQ